MSPNQNPEQIALEPTDNIVQEKDRTIEKKTKFFLLYTPRISLLTCLSFCLFSATFVNAQFNEINCEQPQLVYNDHVGNDWSYDFQVNDKYFSIFKINYFPLIEISKATLIVSETEEKYNDYGTVALGIDPNTLEWDKIYTKSFEVVIKEHNGRYAGNTAKWKVLIHYRKVHGRA